jgi:hypothetical protein
MLPKCETTKVLWFLASLWGQGWDVYTRGRRPPHPTAPSLLGISKGTLRTYKAVSGLATWTENCKWYSSLPLGAVVSLFCESV